MIFSAESNDTGELMRLLQLVICCAVNGENKEKYIQAILSMEHAVQQAIMEAIQEVCSHLLPRPTKTLKQNDDALSSYFAD